jgi:hypothetical protein
VPIRIRDPMLFLSIFPSIHLTTLSRSARNARTTARTSAAQGPSSTLRGGANLLPLERGIDQAADEDGPDDAEAGKRPVALFEDGDERRHDVFLSTGGRGARELRLVV